MRKLNRFLAPHNIRISLLIRMKLQLRDGTFVDKSTSNDFLSYYVHNVGENIYEKVNHFPQCQNAGNNDEAINKILAMLDSIESNLGE